MESDEPLSEPFASRPALLQFATHDWVERRERGEVMEYVRGDLFDRVADALRESGMPLGDAALGAISEIEEERGRLGAGGGGSL